MSGHFPNIPTECHSCPLDDCYPTHKLCPVNRKNKGLPPATTEEVNSLGRPSVLGIAPNDYEGREDYHRQYNKVYMRKYRRIMLRVKLRKTDIELLRSVHETKDRTLEQYITMLLEEMIENAKKKKK